MSYSPGYTRKSSRQRSRQRVAGFIGPALPSGFVRQEYKAVAKRTYNRKKGVARTMGPQYETDNHYFDTERTVTAITSVTTSWAGTEYDPNTSAMLCLFAPVIGDDIFNRTGRKVFVKNIRINGQLSYAAQANETIPQGGVLIRVIVYQDKQTNIAQSQGEDVISSGAASDAIHMYQNVNNIGRFRVLKDKYFQFNQDTVSWDGTNMERDGQIKTFKMNLKINQRLNPFSSSSRTILVDEHQWVTYNATNGGTVADVVDNSFHLIANIDSVSSGASITYKVRTVFTA